MKSYRILIWPEAENDLEEAFAWYEDKRQGLGYDFLLQFEAGIKLIERQPEINPIAYKGTRKHYIKRFPYKIVYFIKQETVIVLAILHGKRSPDILRERAKAI